VQVVEHDAALLHVWWQSLAQVWAQVDPDAQVVAQSPPGHPSVQFAPAAHAYWQSTPLGHVSVQEVFGVQAHAPPSQEKPARGGLDESPLTPASLADVEELPPHPQESATRAATHPGERETLSKAPLSL
jgi:hypothetical protein